MKAPLTKFVPWMRDKSTRQGQYEEQISRDQYVSRNILLQNSRARLGNDSDEEFILQELGSVRKTTDINITYEEASRISEPGVINGRSESTRYDKHG